MPLILLFVLSACCSLACTAVAEETPATTPAPASSEPPKADTALGRTSPPATTRSPPPTSGPVAAVAPQAPVVAPAQVVPPSPSTVPGVRIWPDPAFTHWPAIAYADEQRNVAFSLPVRQPGAAGTIGWAGEKPLPFTLPTDLERISGLLPLPIAPDSHQAELTIAGVKVPGRLALRVVDAREPWPQAALSEGFPVDAKGVPVVLLDRRRDANQERKWALLSSLQKPRPIGKALFLGDPLAALGVSALDGLEMRQRIALDERQPVHAQLTALALDLTSWEGQPLTAGPRTIFWSPGNQALLANTWTQEEERFLGVVRTRLEALNAFPRLVLVLPPAPIDDREPAKALAIERRDLLRRAASWQGWVVLDVERVAGPAEESYRVADGVFATGPVNEARARLAAAFSAELAP